MPTPTSAKARGGEYSADPQMAGIDATSARKWRHAETDVRRLIMLGNAGCSFTDVRYVISAGEFKLAGAPMPFRIMRHLGKRNDRQRAT